MGGGPDGREWTYPARLLARNAVRISFSWRGQHESQYYMR